MTIPLTREQFEELWDLTAGRRLVKRRWVIPEDGVELEIDVFEKLAAVDELRVQQAAGGLKQRLPRLAALAALAQWRARQLVGSMKARPPRKEASSK